MIFCAVIWNLESLGRRRTRKWAHTRHKVSDHWSFGLTRHRLVLIPVFAEKLTFLHFTSIQYVPQFLRCQRQSYLWNFDMLRQWQDATCFFQNMFSFWDCACCACCACDVFRSLAQVLVTRCAAGLVVMAGYLVGAPSGFRTPPVPHGMHVRMQMPQMPRVQPVHRVIHQELLKSSILLEVVLTCSHLSHTCKYQNVIGRVQGKLHLFCFHLRGGLLSSTLEVSGLGCWDQQRSRWWP